MSAALLPGASIARLREVPWEALRGLGDALDPALAEVLAGSAAERALDRLLRSHPGWNAAQRRAAAEGVFGVGLWRRRLRHHAGPDAPPRALLASLVRDLAGLDAATSLLGLPGGGLLPPRDPPGDLATFYSFPDWLADALVREAGPEAPALADALCMPGPVVLRANRLRTDRRALARRLEAEGIRTRPGGLAPDALVVVSPRPNLLGLAAQREGLFEVQDEGSQLVGLAVDARPGEVVLDLCAGAGGKSLQLAAAVGPTGQVLACDPDAGRLGRLRHRAGRAGAGQVRTLGPSAPPGLRVDRVLVDAPCSELGALRRGPDLRFRLDPGGLDGFPALQLSILDAAARALRPGGRLVYATCTLRREEDEEVARAFEEEHPDFQRAPALRARGDAAEGGADAPAHAGLLGPEGFLRTWPHRHGTDGFFAAAWTRS